jgi:Na+-transporting NADH:ubiquinone oxidoreductase subunit NqrB
MITVKRRWHSRRPYIQTTSCLVDRNTGRWRGAFLGSNCQIIGDNSTTTAAAAAAITTTNYYYYCIIIYNSKLIVQS